MRDARDTAEGDSHASAPDVLWLVACIVASSLWCLTAAQQLSATFDEPLYIARGLEGWRSGSHAGLLRLGTMPLPADLQTLPLFVYERWAGVVFDRDDVGALLPWARAVTLIFWAVLLIYGWLAGRELAGLWGGRIAVALLACEPSLLAHAGLATTDVALAACILALVYHFRLGRERAWLQRIALPSLWFGAALLSKASAIVIAPICLVLLEAERRWSTRGTARSRGATSQAWVDIASIIGGGLLIAVLYCGSDWRSEPSFVAWAASLPPESALRAPMLWLAEHLRVFSNAGEAVVRQVRHNIRGHGAYLLGAAYQRAVWYYFPLLLTIKLSEPALIGALFAALLFRRAARNWALLLAAALVLFSLTFRVQLGVRMVLPLVVVLIVGVAAALGDALRRVPDSWARAVTIGIAAALLWNATAALRVWPQGLAYVNRFWGGTPGGYRLVSDSNYDWGQGVKELLEWERRQPAAAPLGVWYFGTDPLARQAPLRWVPLHALPIRSAADVIGAVRGQRLAVSTTLLHGTALSGDAYRAALAVLGEREPIGRTTTFFIYDFTAG